MFFQKRFLGDWDIDLDIEIPGRTDEKKTVSLTSETISDEEFQDALDTWEADRMIEEGEPSEEWIMEHIAMTRQDGEIAENGYVVITDSRMQ